MRKFVYLFAAATLLFLVGTVQAREGRGAPAAKLAQDDVEVSTERTQLNINNMAMWIQSDGWSARNPLNGNSGVTFPRSTDQVIFQDGIIWGGRGQGRQCPGTARRRPDVRDRYGARRHRVQGRGPRQRHGSALSDPPRLGDRGFAARRLRGPQHRFEPSYRRRGGGGARPVRARLDGVASRPGCALLRQRRKRAVRPLG